MKRVGVVHVARNVHPAIGDVIGCVDNGARKGIAFDRQRAIGVTRGRSARSTIGIRDHVVMDAVLATHHLAYAFRRGAIASDDLSRHSSDDRLLVVEAVGAGRIGDRAVGTVLNIVQMRRQECEVGSVVQRRHLRALLEDKSVTRLWQEVVHERHAVREPINFLEVLPFPSVLVKVNAYEAVPTIAEARTPAAL